MHRWLLSPRWLGVHAFLVIVLVVTGTLGWWQLDRARTLHAMSVRVAPAAAPVPLHSALGDSDQVAPADTGRLVTVTGRYDRAHQLLVPHRPLHDRAGFLVVAPLVTATGTVVMVDRGWVPAPVDGGTPSPAPPPATELTVTGWLSVPDPMPEGSPTLAAPGQVAAVNAALLINVVGHPVVDGYIHRMSSEPGAAEGSTPLTPVPRPELRSAGSWPVQNVFYAVQWWVFGGAAIWLWVAMVRHEVDDRRRQLAARTDQLAASARP